MSLFAPGAFVWAFFSVSSGRGREFFRTGGVYALTRPCPAFRTPQNGPGSADRELFPPKKSIPGRSGHFSKEIFEVQKSLFLFVPLNEGGIFVIKAANRGPLGRSNRRVGGVKMQDAGGGARDGVRYGHVLFSVVICFAGNSRRGGGDLCSPRRGAGIRRLVFLPDYLPFHISPPSPASLANFVLIPLLFWMTKSQMSF